MPIDIKVDTQQFLEIESNIVKTAKDVLAGQALKAEIGDFAVERLKYQVRIGKPFNSEKDLPSLKESTIKTRTYLSKYNETHATFEAGFSNLTITGNLMDSLRWVDEGNTLIRLEFAGNHPRYKSKNGLIGKEIPNQTLVGYLAEKGFKPFDMSLDDNKQFVSRIRTICLRYIRRALRIRNALADDDEQA